MAQEAIKNYTDYVSSRTKYLETLNAMSDMTFTEKSWVEYYNYILNSANYDVCSSGTIEGLDWAIDSIQQIGTKVQSVESRFQLLMKFTFTMYHFASDMFFRYGVRDSTTDIFVAIPRKLKLLYRSQFEESDVSILASMNTLACAAYENSREEEGEEIKLVKNVVNNYGTIYSPGKFPTIPDFIIGLHFYQSALAIDSGDESKNQLYIAFRCLHESTKTNFDKIIYLCDVIYG